MVFGVLRQFAQKAELKHYRERGFRARAALPTQGWHLGAVLLCVCLVVFLAYTRTWVDLVLPFLKPAVNCFLLRKPIVGWHVWEQQGPQISILISWNNLTFCFCFCFGMEALKKKNCFLSPRIVFRESKTFQVIFIGPLFMAPTLLIIDPIPRGGSGIQLTQLTS